MMPLPNSHYHINMGVIYEEQEAGERTPYRYFYDDEEDTSDYESNVDPVWLLAGLATFAVLLLVLVVVAA